MLKSDDNQLNKFLSSEKFLFLKELYDDCGEGKCIYYNNKVIYTNKALSLITGYSSKDLFSFRLQNFTNYIHPDFISTLQNQIEEITAGGCRDKSFDLMIIKKDKSFIWITFSLKISKFENVPFFLVTVVDISEKKRMEQNINQSAALYKNIISSSPESICIINSFNIIVVSNLLAAKTLGFESETDIVGKLYISFVCLEDRKTAKNIQKELLLTEQIQTGKLGLIKKDKTIIPISLRASLVKDKNNFLINSIIIFKNITKKIQLENQRQSQYDALQTIHNLSVKINQTNDINDIYYEAFLGLKSLISIDRAAILLKDQNEFTKFVYWANLSEKFRDSLLADFSWESSILNCSPIIVEDLSNSLSLGQFKENTLAEGIKAFGVFPIFYENKLWGGLAVFFNNITSFSEEKIASIITVTNQIAFAIYRYQNENNLLKSREEYKTFIEISHEIVLTMDFEGNFLSINKVGLRITGFTLDEFLGISYKYFISPEFHTIIDNNIQLLKAGAKKISPFEILAFKKDKSLIWLEITAGVKYEYSVAVCIFVVARDITERKKAEIKLIESKNSYRELVENAFDLIFTLDINGNFIFANNTAYKYFGYELDEKLNFNIFDILDERYVELIKTRIKEKLSGVIHNNSIEVLAYTKQNKPIWLEINSKIHYLDGKPVEIVGAAKNITQNKIAEEELKNYYINLENLISIRTKELQNSEEKFRALAENSYDIIMRFNEKGEHLYVNKIVKAATGLNPEDFIGKTHKQLGFPEELCNTCEQVLNKTFKLGKRHQVELLLPNGIWIDWVLFPEFDSSGKVISVISSGRDITERKQKENELMLKDRALSKISEAIQNILQSKDIYSSMESALELIAGAVNLSSIYIFENFTDSQNTETGFIQKFKWSNNNYSANLNNTNNVFSYINNFKRWFDFLQNKKVLFDFTNNLPDCEKEILKTTNIVSFLLAPVFVNGKFWGFVGFSENNYEREWTKSEISIIKILAESIGGVFTRMNFEDSLRQSEQWWKFLFESAPGSYFITDFKGVVINTNKEFERICGYSKNELIGKNLFEAGILNFESLDGFHSVMLEASKDSSMERVELLIKTKKNKELIVEMSFFSVLLNLEKYILVSAYDIQQRKKVELELKKALDKQKELNELKSSFLSLVSHEFKTPLTTILSSADLIDMYGSTMSKEKFSGHIVKIQKQVEYLNEMLNDVLTLNIAESGALAYKPVSFNLNTYCSDIVENIKSLNTTDNNIEYKFSGSDENVFADNKLIKNIVQNLLTNAVKYSPPKTKIDIDVQVFDNFINLKVKDFGVGISKKEIDKIFIPFFRSEKNIHVSGTGLGLSIAKYSAEIHGGKISVESSLGVGSLFSVTLPQKRI
ncbi:MAG: PAS domain S-box protein [bacterium]